MEPKKVGRTLGIGVRVASNMLRERVERAAAAHSAPVEAGNGRPAAPAPPRASIKIDSKVAGAKRGAKAFGQAFLGPFTHAGSILWLEITGLFFALFALFFVQSVYRVRGPGGRGRNMRTCCCMLPWLLALPGFRSARSPARTARASAAPGLDRRTTCGILELSHAGTTEGCPGLRRGLFSAKAVQVSGTTHFLTM